MPLLALALAGGCRSKGKPAPTTVSVDSGGSLAAAVVPDAQAATPAWRTDPVFSAPIAAARMAQGSVVAGLVATQKVIRVVGFPDGKPSWTTDVLPGVKWSEAAELGIQRAADGVVVFWRDSAVGPGGAAVFLGPDGQMRDTPLEVGSAVCTTVGGIAWIAARPIPPAPEHAVHVLARAWGERAGHEVMTLSPDRSPTLVCGTHSVFALADGDDDLTVDVFVPGSAAARRPTLVIRNSDFADEEREHESFTVADDLEIARVGVGGSVATRTVMGDRDASPWRRLKHVLSDEDDLVAIDGQPQRSLFVFTRDSDSACPTPESGGQRVRALDVDRATGADRLVELAPPDCQGQRGPFWIPAGLAEARGPIVAWVERGPGTGDRKVPPISGLTYRVLGPQGVRSGRLSIAADALVDGDCDDAACFAAALLREPGGDGMSPGPIAVVTYP
jgi:hypothetical protein